MTSLNDQQLAAVNAPLDRPVMVVAGPGSGKTRVLVERVAHILREGAEPSRVVLTTFTTDAAFEMKSRIGELVGIKKSAFLIAGTIHALCLRILREEGYPTHEVLKSSLQKWYINDATGPRGANLDVGWRVVLDFISWMKRLNISPGEAPAAIQSLGLMPPQSRARGDVSKFISANAEYEAPKRKEVKIDFEDMLYLVRRMFDERPQVLSKWQGRVDYLHVDEAQDTSTTSMEVLYALSAPENRIFICGDPDQALYRWNGADPFANIFGFKQRFPDGVVRLLETNYRSTVSVVAAANLLIGGNYPGPVDGSMQEAAATERSQYRKVLKVRPSAPRGEGVKVSSHLTGKEEAEGIRQEIEALVDRSSREGAVLGSYRDIFVISRTNAQLRNVESELAASSIPFVVRGALGFFERAEIKDVLGMVGLALNRHDDEAFERSANIASTDFQPYGSPKHSHGFGKRFMEELRGAAATRSQPPCSLWDAMSLVKLNQPTMQRKGVEDLETLMADIRKRSLLTIEECERHGEGCVERGGASCMSAVLAVNAARELAYDQHLIHEDGIDMNAAMNEGTFDNLAELSRAASNFKTLAGFLAYVESVQVAERQRRDEENPDAVSLMTVHKSKGLESDTVFVIGMSEGLLPHHRSITVAADSPAPISFVTPSAEDERCVAFVAVSRAKNRLYLSFPLTLGGKELQPSRFLREMGLLPESQDDVKVEADTGHGVGTKVPLVST